jgi:hypothetical protein
MTGEPESIQTAAVATATTGEIKTSNNSATTRSRQRFVAAYGALERT